MGDLLEVLRHIVVPSLRYRLIGLHEGEAPDGVAAAGEDDPLDPGQPGGLVYVIGADDVAGEVALPAVDILPGVGCQMDHHVDTGERWPDGVQVGDIGLQARHALDGPTVQGAELVSAGPLQVAPEQSSYEPTHACYEYLLHDSSP